MDLSNPNEPTGTASFPAKRIGRSASTRLGGRVFLTAWLASILVHITGLAGMFFLAFPFTTQESDADSPTPYVQLIGPVDGVAFVPSDVPEASPPTLTPDASRIHFEPRPFDPPVALAPQLRPELSIIGVGAGGGTAADFGLRVGGEKGPEFFGVGQSARGARKIVYVVDRSGSMIDTFDYVRQELKRSISSLRRSQKFHVIFFNAREPLESPPKKLVSAIEAYIGPFFEFLDKVVPSGGTKPQAAIRRALALKPDLVYLLSDGIDFHPTLLDKLADWNRDRRVRIFTIAYLDQSGRAILEKIAREYDGEFKFVSEHDLP